MYQFDIVFNEPLVIIVAPFIEYIIFLYLPEKKGYKRTIMIKQNEPDLP